MSRNSNHNVRKGPFVYKQTYLAILLCSTLWFIWLFLSNDIFCLQMFNFDGQEDDQAAYDLNISLDGPFLVVIVTPYPCPRFVCLMPVTK